MKQLLDYDPLTGTKEWFEYDHITDTFTITVDQDVSKFLDVVKKRRNDESYSQKGIKEEWWHYAAIPNLVIAELRKKGIDVFNKHQTKEVIREINQNYPALKLTTKKHA